MRLLPLCLLLMGTSLAAQEAPKKKASAAKKQAAHAKATPEQIRKFKQLEEKQKK